MSKYDKEHTHTKPILVKTSALSTSGSSGNHHQENTLALICTHLVHYFGRNYFVETELIAAMVMMVDNVLSHLSRRLLVLLCTGEGFLRWRQAGSQHSRDSQCQQQQQQQCPHAEWNRSRTSRGATPADSFIQSSALSGHWRVNKTHKKQTAGLLKQHNCIWLIKEFQTGTLFVSVVK